MFKDTSLSQRFDKLVERLSALHMDIKPFAFRAVSPISSTGITACLFYSEAWLDQALDFAGRWNGPMSIVVEVIASSSNWQDAADVYDRIASLRSKSHRLLHLADFHVVFRRTTTSASLRRALHRALAVPQATNLQLNLARFFALTDLVWLCGDPHILPSFDMHESLQVNEQLRELTMEYGDAVIIPIFGQMHRGSRLAMPNLEEVFGQIAINGSLTIDSRGIFAKVAQKYILQYYSAMPMTQAAWPVSKVGLLPLIRSLDNAMTTVSQPVFHLSPNYEANNDLSLLNSWLFARGAPEEGLKPFTNYFADFSPSLVIGKDRQPWCRERLEHNRAACVHQMYLSGARFWLLSDGWAYTTEDLDSSAKAEPPGENERLLVSRILSSVFK